MKLFKTFVLCGWCLSLLACQQTPVPLARIEIAPHNTQTVSTDEPFNWAQFTLKKHYDDGSIQKIQVEANMIHPEDLVKTSLPGRHQIRLDYLGLKTSFELLIFESPLIKQLKMYHQLGLEQGLIEDDYEAWLSSLRGKDGTSIQEVWLDKEGHLWMKTCEDTLLHAGQIIIPRLELQLHEGVFQWRINEDAWVPLWAIEDFPEGPPGPAIEMSIIADEMVWRVQGSIGWQPLIPLEKLRGEKGSSVELHVSQGAILWRVQDHDAWHELILLRALNGDPGKDGRTPILRQQNSVLQWQYQETETWFDLFDLNDLIGPQGTDGRPIELDLFDHAIQWRYLGEIDWRPLVTLNQLQGPQGEKGLPIELDLLDDAIHWRYIGEKTWQALIHIEDLRGPRGLRGTEGPQGEDGKSVVFRWYGQWLQWQHVGSQTWHNLIDLPSIQGPPGQDGLSAYELFMKAHPESTYSEAAWLASLKETNKESVNEFNVISILHENARYGQEVLFQGSLYALLDEGYVLTDGTHLLNVHDPFVSDIYVGDEVVVNAHYLFERGHWHLTHVLTYSSVQASSTELIKAKAITLEALWQQSLYDKLTFATLFDIRGYFDASTWQLSDIETGLWAINVVMSGDVDWSFYDQREISLKGQIIIDQYQNERYVHVYGIRLIEYQIMFETQTDAIFDPLWLEAGSTFTALPFPVRQGYQFNGWALDPDGNNMIEVSMTLTHDVTLYAIWSETDETLCVFDAHSVRDVYDSPLNQRYQVYGIVSAVHPLHNILYLQDNDGQAIMVGHWDTAESLKHVSIGDCVVVEGDRLTRQGQEQLWFSELLDVLSSGHPVQLIQASSADELIEHWDVWVNHQISLKELQIKDYQDDFVVFESSNNAEFQLVALRQYEALWRDYLLPVDTILENIVLTLDRTSIDRIFIVDIYRKED